MIIELYSKRLKKEQESELEVYRYDNIPEKLRVQIYHIWTESIGTDRDMWELIHNTMIKELGIIQLTDKFYNDYEDGCRKFLIDNKNIEEIIDIIELSFVVIDKVIRERDSRIGYKQFNRIQSPDDAIHELNYRFNENQIGYEYIEGKLIRIDRKFTHNEIIKPAIKLLYEEEFEGACNEFLQAHKQYRNKEYKEAIVSSQKAFESTMKTICEKMNYTYNKDKDTASKLISILCDNDLIPISLKTHFEGLKSSLSGVKTSLEAGLPTLRNRNGGHGQGESIAYVPESLVTYAINLSATNIILLVNLYKDVK